MCLWVCGIHELTHNDGTGCLVPQLISAPDGTAHALAAWRKDNLCPVARRKLATLDGHGLGHNENCLVPSPRCEHRQTDTGVSRCRLDHGATRHEAAVGLCSVQHGEHDAVLHRTPRIACLVFSKDGSLATRNGREIDKWG